MKIRMNQWIEWIKRYKILLGVSVFALMLLLVSLFFNHDPHSSQSTTAKTYQSGTNRAKAVDVAAGDDAAESLNALTEQLHQVIASNQKLQSNNAALNQKNAKILKNIHIEVQQNLTADLKKHGDTNQAQIKTLQHSLAQVNKTMNQLKRNKTYGQYHHVDGHPGSEGQAADIGHLVTVNGEQLVSLPMVKGRVNENMSNTVENNVRDNDFSVSGVDRSGSILHPNIPLNAMQPKKPKVIPYYTIPSGSTLAQSVTLSALIGRVPVDGVVKSPYPFKMIIGPNNMAANGQHIAGISGAIIQGYTVGDMALSCVKGYITTLTFLFPDGRISTTHADASSDSLGFNSALGYISEPNGNPCFSGKFYTNAPSYLATMMTLGALNVGGSAYQQAQQTTTSHPVGGTTSMLTGSVGKAILGGAVQGGTQQVMTWYTQREKNSFDAVYVPSGQKAVINISKQININYNPTGRKINDAPIQSTHNAHSLD